MRTLVVAAAAAVVVAGCGGGGSVPGGPPAKHARPSPADVQPAPDASVSAEDAYVAAARASDDPWLRFDLPDAADDDLVAAGYELCRFADGTYELASVALTMATRQADTFLQAVPRLTPLAGEFLCPHVGDDEVASAMTVLDQRMRLLANRTFVDTVRRRFGSQMPDGTTDTDLLALAADVCDLAARGVGDSEVIVRVGDRYGWDVTVPAGTAGSPASRIVDEAYAYFCPWQAAAAAEERSGG